MRRVRFWSKVGGIHEVLEELKEISIFSLLYLLSGWERVPEETVANRRNESKLAWIISKLF